MGTRARLIGVLSTVLLVVAVGSLAWTGWRSWCHGVRSGTVSAKRFIPAHTEQRYRRFCPSSPRRKVRCDAIAYPQQVPDAWLVSITSGGVRGLCGSVAYHVDQSTFDRLQVGQHWQISADAVAA